jgi:hypothetical protein
MISRLDNVQTEKDVEHNLARMIDVMAKPAENIRRARKLGHSPMADAASFRA